TVIPSSGTGSQIQQSANNQGTLSGSTGGTGPCPGPGCAVATGSVIVTPSPTLEGRVSGDAGAQELLELNFFLNMVGETIVGPIFPTSTGFLGVTLFVDGTQTNNDTNSSSLVVSRLDVGSSFAGGGDTQTCNVRLTKPLGSTGSENTSGGCLDIVP